jgi:uncharacterized membrane protein
MNNETIIIKQSKKQLFIVLLLGGGIVGAYSIALYKNPLSIYQHPVVTIFLGVLFSSVFIYHLVELINRKPEIILSDEGIDIRYKGFYHWKSLRSFKTTERSSKSGYDTFLVLYFKDSSNVKIEITQLEKGRKMIVELLLQYVSIGKFFYIGHESAKWTD